jgi:hypothetical protein
MRRLVLSGIVTTLLFGLVGCGGDDDKPKSDPKPSPSSKASDDVAGIITDNPTDLKWRLPDVPTSWKRLQTSDGEGQWQVGRTCVITLSQPAGLGKTKEPTQEQVLDEYAKRTGKALGTTLDITGRDTSMFPLVTDAKDISASTKVSHAKLTGAKGVEGEIYAHRSGDFALVLTTFCGQGAFAGTNASDFQPFISKLAITATY